MKQTEKLKNKHDHTMILSANIGINYKFALFDVTLFKNLLSEIKPRLCYTFAFKILYSASTKIENI